MISWAYLWLHMLFQGEKNHANIKEVCTRRESNNDQIKNSAALFTLYFTFDLIIKSVLCDCCNEGNFHDQKIICYFTINDYLAACWTDNWIDRIILISGSNVDQFEHSFKQKIRDRDDFFALHSADVIFLKKHKFNSPELCRARMVISKAQGKHAVFVLHGTAPLEGTQCTIAKNFHCQTSCVM